MKYENDQGMRVADREIETTLLLDESEEIRYTHLRARK
jgi:hypothetical protein